MAGRRMPRDFTCGKPAPVTLDASILPKEPSPPEKSCLRVAAEGVGFVTVCHRTRVGGLNAGNLERGGRPVLAERNKRRGKCLGEYP